MLETTQKRVMPAGGEKKKNVSDAQKTIKRKEA